MTEITEIELRVTIAEFGGADADWSDSLNVQPLLRAAQQCGVLDYALDVHQLASFGRCEDSFLLIRRLEENITLCSAPIHWRDMRPDESLSDGEAIRHLLRRLAEDAARLLGGFRNEALLRRDPRLTRVRELARAATGIDQRWAAESACLRDEEGGVLVGLREVCLPAVFRGRRTVWTHMKSIGFGRRWRYSWRMCSPRCRARTSGPRATAICGD
jgi:hypothetical protein